MPHVWCLCSLKRIVGALDWNPGHYEMPGWVLGTELRVCTGTVSIHRRASPAQFLVILVFSDTFSYKSLMLIIKSDDIVIV